MTPECFRERLLALAIEYERLQMRYEAALAEKCQIRIFETAKEAQDSKKDVDTCDTATADAAPSVPLIAKRAELLGVQPEDMRTDTVHPGQLSTCGMRATAEPHDDAGYDPVVRSDNEITAGKSGVAPRVRVSLQLPTGTPGMDALPSSSANSSSKRRDPTISRSKLVVHSSYEEGLARRRRCMLDLDLVDDVSEEDAYEDCDLDYPPWSKSENSVTTGEDLLLAEQIQDLWIKFAHMDKQGRGFVTCRDLNKYDHSATLSGIQSLARMRRYSHTIEGFNLVMNSSQKGAESDNPELPQLGFMQRTNTSLSNASKISSKKGATLTFPYFVEMMLMEECEQICGKELADDIFEIRQMFKLAGVLDLIAGTTNVDHKDIENEKLCISTGYAIETVTGAVILINAIVIGVSIDVMEDWKGWTYLEISFGCFFFCELLFKIVSQGWRCFFCGEDRWWNLFDTIIVSMAVIDMLMMIKGSVFEELNSITMIRMVRLFRVVRMVRLMKNRYFKELTLMVRGLIHGLRTLFWAMVLLLSLVYMIGVLLRQTVGAHQSRCTHVTPECNKDRVYLYKNRDNFSTVWKAMFTTFRCLVDGCSSADGTPFMIPLMNVYGWPVVVGYFLIVVFVIFGLFNLIMAIFVENTLEAAKHDEMQRQFKLSREHIRVARKLRKLVSHFSTSKSFHSVGTASWISKAMSKAPGLRSKEDLAGDTAHPNTLSFGTLEITRERFEAVIMQKEVAAILCDLSINVDNPKSLFDVLDVDEQGAIDLKHMVTGLMQLRGTAEKTDAVACILGMKAIRKNLRSFEFILTRNLRDLWKDVGATNDRLEQLGELMRVHQLQSKQAPAPLKASL